MATLTFTEINVPTAKGKIRGLRGDGVIAFKGIRYAEPPFGVNRFKPPQPVRPWIGTRDALAFGPKAPQLPYPPMISMMIPEMTVPGEDCLTLNVWAPETVTAPCPVVVWIPGGMFEYHGTGASPQYDGSTFARDGVVCVTINYRVGAEGFLFLGDGVPNRGLLDQLAALEWVRDNIAAFGGDPLNVTIFGESAGALSIGTLLSMPRAKGLFRRAIAQSGASHHAISCESARLVGTRLAEILGVQATDEAVSRVPWERVLEAQGQLRADFAVDPNPRRWGQDVVLSGLPWQPVVDGDILPALPFEHLETASEVDLLVGTNTDEHRLFLAPGGGLDQITDGALQGLIHSYGLPEKTLAAYRELYPDATCGDLFAAIQTDWYWRIPAIRLAEAHTAGPGATYMYEFAWRSPQFGGALGACHAIELSFVFDSLGHSTEPLLGPEPPQVLADTMHAAWVAFAKTGDPGWPKYKLAERATMRFDERSRVVLDPRQVERDIWAGVR